MATLTIIKEFFDNYDYLTNEVTINKAEKITDLKKFVEVNISYLEHNTGNKRFLPYYNRLLFVYKELSKK